MSSNHSYSTICAACKCLRRKCAVDCLLAPYFPSSNPQRFASVHKIFGAANTTKMLEHVPAHLRDQAADCMIFESAMRMRDPVYGSVGIISQLQQQITQVLNEIMKIQGQLALHSAQNNQARTVLHLQRIGDKSNNGLDVGPGPGPGPGPHFATRPFSWAYACLNNGRHYELELDELYAKFNQQS